MKRLLKVVAGGNGSHLAIGGIDLALAALVGLFVIWIIIRQLTPRAVKRKPFIYIIIMLLGLQTAGSGLKKVSISPEFIALTLVGSLLLPILFGWLRARTYKFWLSKDDLVMRRGNWLTLSLWLLNLAIHAGLTVLDPKGATLFMTFEIGLTLLVQRELAYRLAARQFPNEIENN